MKKQSMWTVWPVVAVAAMILAAIFLRPLLPIDETRYMSVAWEMWLRRGWLSPLTMNFEPYHHKPPFLFWMINLSWSVFGVSRWAALLPVAASTVMMCVLTVKLAQKLMPEGIDETRLAFLVTGSVPYLIYGTLVMFDVTIGVFVLAALLCVLDYAEKKRIKSMLLAGLFIGLGVLTKGPVAYLYVIFPMILAPLWVKDFVRGAAWTRDCMLALLVSFVPVLFWLVPVLLQADNHFAVWLLWEQTAGRVTGGFSDAHIRPFYFYLPLLPAMLAPWIFFLGFWRGIKKIDRTNYAVRFLACWIVPVFLCFCMISGKQPHYLLPLLPGALILIFLLLRDVSTAAIRNVAISMVFLIIAGQAAASLTYFRQYDLTPVADYIRAHPDKDIAFARNYHAEIGYLAKLEKPVDDLQYGEVEGWFNVHPDGLAVIGYKNDAEVSAYRKYISTAYRGKNLGVFGKKADGAAEAD